MSREDFLDAIGQIDESFVEEASESSYNRRINRIRNFSLLAAAVLVLGISARFFLPGILGEKTSSPNAEGEIAAVTSNREARDEKTENVDGEDVYVTEQAGELTREISEQQEYYSSAPKSEMAFSDAPEGQEKNGQDIMPPVNTGSFVPEGIMIEAAVSPDNSDVYLMYVEIDQDKISGWEFSDSAAASRKELFRKEEDGYISVLYELDDVKLSESDIVAWLNVTLSEENEEMYEIPVHAADDEMSSEMQEAFSQAHTEE